MHPGCLGACLVLYYISGSMIGAILDVLVHDWRYIASIGPSMICYNACIGPCLMLYCMSWSMLGADVIIVTNLDALLAK